MRLLLNFSARPTTPGNTLDVVHAVHSTSAQAFTGGAFPIPGVDNPNWYLLDYIHENPVVGSDPMYQQRHYDIRTARRLQFGEDSALVHIIRNDGLDSAQYTVNCRLLLKLP